MPGRNFLVIAREVVRGATEYHWRSAAIHAYYGLFLECRDTLSHWGKPVPRGTNVHSFVRLQFTYAGDASIKQIGHALDKLVQLRNRANYDLQALRTFSTDTDARDAIHVSTTALALLDAIQGDPVRRAAAIAALPP